MMETKKSLLQQSEKCEYADGCPQSNICGTNNSELIGELSCSLRRVRLLADGYKIEW